MARGLDLVGERWTLLLVRELLLGVRRYGELRESLPGVTTNLLAERLKSMEAQGLVQPVDGGYQLTPLGASLEPVVMELARFGGKSMAQPLRGERLDPSWALLSLKRRYVGGLDVRLGLRVDDTWFTLAFEPNWLRVVKRRPERAAASIHVETAAFRALFFAGVTLEALKKSGAVAVDGDAKRVTQALRALLPPAFAHQPPPRENHARWSPQTVWAY